MIRPSASRLAAHAEAAELVAAFIASGRTITGAAPETAQDAPETAQITCDGSIGWASRYLPPVAPKLSQALKKEHHMPTYRLASSPAISAPGMVTWAINGAHFPRDRKTMANVIAQGWSLPMDAAMALVTCKVPYTVEGETVVFTVS